MGINAMNTNGDGERRGSNAPRRIAAARLPGNTDADCAPTPEARPHV
jgi:hypothetical protein